jgi:hypothetical protein
MASPRMSRVEDPAAFGVGWVQQHAAAQHVHGAMIAQQTPPGCKACSSRPPAAGNPALGHRQVRCCRTAVRPRRSGVRKAPPRQRGWSEQENPSAPVNRHSDPSEPVGGHPRRRKRPPTGVCAGHRLGGAPRRNRTGDPILTIDARRVGGDFQVVTDEGPPRIGSASVLFEIRCVHW